MIGTIEKTRDASQTVRNRIHPDAEEQSDPAVMAWPDMSLDLARTALVLVDPQTGFLERGGNLWPAVGKGVIENNVVEHLEWLLETAEFTGMLRVVCPHRQGAAPGEHIGVDRVSAWAGRLGDATLPGRTPDHDILPRLQPFLQGGNVVNTAAHGLCGMAGRDLLQELRARRIEQVILAGMCANLCLEGHLRDLIENGFSVAVVSDATAGTMIGGQDGHAAAMSSFRLLAHAVWNTRETILRMYGKNV